MYEPHLDFDAPPLETPIWRYLEFWKFESMMRTWKLFFANASAMTDRFEGSYPRRSGDFSHRQDLSPERQESAADSFRDFRQHAKDFLNIVYLNCWHINASESDAMWRLYVPDGNGVAIRSEFQLLRDSFEVERRIVQIGMVDYIDFDHDAIEPRYGYTVFLPFLRKRLAFQHEQELRAIVLDTQGGESDSIVTVRHIAGLSPMPGIAVACDLSTLIEEVIVAPNASREVVDDVRQLVCDSMLAVPVRRSSLDAEPCW